LSAEQLPQVSNKATEGAAPKREKLKKNIRRYINIANANIIQKYN
jgi:hypothetical protein